MIAIKLMPRSTPGIILAVFTWKLCASPAAYGGEPTEGPWVKWESFGSQAASETDGISASDYRAAMISARVLFPLSTNDKRYTLVPYLRYSQSESQWLRSGKTEDVAGTLRNITPGLILTSMTFPEQSGVYAAFFQHRHPDTSRSFEPLNEYIVGIHSERWLNRLLGSPDFEVYGRLSGRIRDYPGRRTYLLVPEVSVLKNDGWLFSVGWPSHVIVGKFNSSQSRFTSAEMEISSYNYPGEFEGMAGWVDGYTAALFASWREEVYKPLHFGIRAGTAFQAIKFYDNDGIRKWTYSGKPATYLALTATTLF